MRGDDHGLHRETASSHQLLLAPGHVLMRNFDAEITPRNHDGVAQLDDVVDPLECCRLLDLGHQAGAVADQASRLDDVGGLLHEGQGDPVHAEVQTELQIEAVLGGERR